MRLLFMGNGKLGADALAMVRAAGTEVVALALHPADKRRDGDALLAAAGLPPERVFDAARLEEPAVHEALAALGCDLALSVQLGYILRAPFLALFPRGVVNLHTSLLPWNRGAQPNFWAIAERTPAGASLHYIDAGVDTGDLIAQVETPVAPTDTGATLYARLQHDALQLLGRTWPALAAGVAPRTPQPAGGSAHRVRDRAQVDEIDLGASVRAGDLIDLLRAASFPPHRGAFFRAGGKRIFLRLELEEES